MIIVQPTSTGAPFYSNSKIDLTSCQIGSISTIQQKIFPKQLQQLYLTNNNLESIKQISNLKLENLSFLHLGVNKIDSIDIFSRDMFTKLVFLSLENNKLSNIDTINQWKMPSLRTLYLNKNQIQNICALDRAEFPSLNTLSLGRNLIQCIKPLTGLRAPFLSTLVLYGNQIFDFDVVLLMNFLRLNSLDIGENPAKMSVHVHRALVKKLKYGLQLQM